jgi:hypothetical protein
MTANQPIQKKLILNKQTISALTRQHYNNALGWGDPFRCFENLWTLYYCDMIISELIPEAVGDNPAPDLNNQIKF